MRRLTVMVEYSVANRVCNDVDYLIALFIVSVWCEHWLDWIVEIALEKARTLLSSRHYECPPGNIAVARSCPTWLASEDWPRNDLYPCYMMLLATRNWKKYILLFFLNLPFLNLKCSPSSLHRDECCLLKIQCYRLLKIYAVSSAPYSLHWVWRCLLWSFCSSCSVCISSYILNRILRSMIFYVIFDILWCSMICYDLIKLLCHTRCELLSP